MDDYEQGEIIVMFRGDIAPAEAEKTVTDLGLSVKDRMGACLYLVAVAAGSEVDWIEKFRGLSSVMHAELNRRITITVT